MSATGIATDDQVNMWIRRVVEYLAIMYAKAVLEYLFVYVSYALMTLMCYVDNVYDRAFRYGVFEFCAKAVPTYTT